MAKHILKLKEKDKATFFSLANEWCLPAPSVIKPEEREIVVDSRASMYMLSRRDLNSAEMETVRVSKSPKTVVAANGEVANKRRSDSACLLVEPVKCCRTVGHITACNSGHDIDILLTLRRLGPKSDHEKIARIIPCAQHA